MLGFVDKKSNRIDDRITTGFSQLLFKMPLPDDSRLNHIKHLVKQRIRKLLLPGCWILQLDELSNVQPINHERWAS
jgi:hypothetical protein